MAHFAKLDENNIVQRVEVVHNNEAPTEEAGAAFLNKIHKTSDVWKQTSYNTRAGVHQLGGTPFRKNYAGPDRYFCAQGCCCYNDQPKEGRDVFVRFKLDKKYNEKES